MFGYRGPGAYEDRYPFLCGSFPLVRKDKHPTRFLLGLLLVAFFCMFFPGNASAQPASLRRVSVSTQGVQGNRSSTFVYPYNSIGMCVSENGE